MDDLKSDVKHISGLLIKKQKDFDNVMDTARDMIREAAHAITNLHNEDYKTALKHLAAADRMAKSLKKFDVAFEYYTRQAYQEFAEAKIFYELKKTGKVLSRSTVGVSIESYLLGLMDVMGELKREILEELRKGNVKKAEQYFNNMRHIYDSTRSLRFAEAVLSGFRKKQDVARIQLENAGNEILSVIRHREVRK